MLIKWEQLALASSSWRHWQLDIAIKTAKLHLICCSQRPGKLDESLKWFWSVCLIVDYVSGCDWEPFRNVPLTMISLNDSHIIGSPDIAGLWFFVNLVKPGGLGSSGFSGGNDPIFVLVYTLEYGPCPIPLLRCEDSHQRILDWKKKQNNFHIAFGWFLYCLL